MMKRIKSIFILGLICVLGVTVSCENVDFGDLNENPNGATEGNPSSLMANAMINYATATGRDYLIRPTLYVQYQSQVTYTTEMRYSETPSSWYTYYVGSLEGLHEVIQYASNPDNQGATLNAQGAPENQIGVAMLMQAEIVKRLADTYGSVPFSEALVGLDNLTPAYDSQEDVYKSLFTMVKEARDMMDDSKKGPTGDVIYGGDVAKWQQYANSLLLQMAIQLSDVYPDASGFAATEFNAALSDAHGVIETPEAEAWFTYEDVSGFRNPWFANRTRDYFLSAEFVDALQGDDTEYNPTSNMTFDSRLSVYSKDAELEGVPYGYRDESGAGKNQMSTKNYWNATSSLPMMTAAYTYLNRAEAAELGWTSEDAEMMLKTGIMIDYESLDYHHGTSISEDAEAYADARVADAATVGLLQVIREEKWVALFAEGFDAWAEWRRTETPDLQPATDFINGGEIPARYNYPSEESSLNNASYTEGVSRLTPAEDNNTSRTWWDVD